MLAACGGSTSPAPAPSPSPIPANPVVDPCAAALGRSTLPRTVGSPSDKRLRADGHSPWRVLDNLWTHRTAARRGFLNSQLRPAVAEDIGEIAVLEDAGDLVLPANAFDLTGRGIRFAPAGSVAYDATALLAEFRTPLGDRLSLGDDDGAERALPFAFRLFDQSHTSVFVNSDGNLTFGEVDRASTERNLARLLTGPPRAAPFLADLDPSAGGGVFYRTAADAFTVTWCSVPGFDVPETTTFQISLLQDGAVEMRYGQSIGLGDAIVGVSPGRTTEFTAADLSAGTTGSVAAVGERFSRTTQLDTVAVARAFYRSHPDAYDQLVVWTDARFTQDSFAWEATVANEVQGIGLDLFDFSAEHGSGGRLRSFVMMDFIGKYPDDPTTVFLGANNTLSLLGQEAGHRWLVFLRVLDHNRRVSEALLGRDSVHWSFFVDSDASVMEGNDIADLGGGSFRTVAAVRRFSPLDQYAMGLVAESDVPAFFYVESPVNVSPSVEADSAPRIGVTFNGTRRDVLIQDIVAVMGRRVPGSSTSPRVHRQAFLFVRSRGGTVDPAQVAKIDRIRRTWESFFVDATDGRMRAETRLRPPS